MKTYVFKKLIIDNV